MRIRLSMTALAAAFAVPTAAHAQSHYRWCIDAADSGVDFTPCDTAWVCDGPVLPSIEAAVESARATPDASPGVRPTRHDFCVRTPGTHTESIVLDNADGQLGEEQHFFFSGVAELCPEPGAGPTFDLTGSTQVARHQIEIFGLSVDLSTCGTPERSLVHVEDSELSINNARIVGGAGPLIVSAQASPDTPTVFRFSRAEGGEGPFFEGDASLLLQGAEISRFQSIGDGSLITLLGVEAQLETESTALFGNVVSGGASLVSSGGRIYFYRSLAAANVVLDGGSLFHSTLEDGVRSARFGVDSSVISRNVLLAGGDASPPPYVFVPLATPDPSDLCLPQGADQRSYFDRAVPTNSGSVSGAALFRVEGTQLLPRASLSLLKNFIVQNQLGASAGLLEVDGAVDGIDAVFVHNTIDQPGASLFRGGGTGVGASYLSARNLFLSDPAPVLGAPWSWAEVSMDEAPGGAASMSPPLADAGGIVGPFPELFPFNGATRFETAETARSGPDCFQATRVCPEVQLDCSSSPAAWCALDAAAEYLPTASTITDSWIRWPWIGDLDLRALLEPDAAVPGATGWNCEQHLFPWDQFVFGSSEVGDADPFSTLTDCDNDDADVVPGLPADDGISSEDCDRVVDCYICPGDEEDVGFDDDDSAVSDDDDSTSPVDDDDDSAPPLTDDDDSASDPTPPPPSPSCLRSGCGVAYTCSDGPVVGVVLPAFLLTSRRRRGLVKECSDPPSP